MRKFAERNTYNYLGILDADTIKQKWMQEQSKKEKQKTPREKKFRSKILIKGRNTWAVDRLRYSVPFLKRK